MQMGDKLMERLSSNVLIRLEATACLKRFILNLWTSTEGVNNILKLKPPVFGVLMLLVKKCC